MKIMCSGWSTLPPFRYALMRLLPLLRNAVHISFEVMAAKTCCCVVCHIPVSAPEQMTQPCQGFIWGVFLCHSVLCTMRHITHKEGRTWLAAVAMQSKPASPGLSIPSSVPAQPVPSASREGESIQPFLGTPFIHAVLFHQNPVAQPWQQEWCGGEPELGEYSATEVWAGPSTAMRPLPMALLCSRETRRSSRVCHITKATSAPVQVQNEPCSWDWPQACRNLDRFPIDSSTAD